jgi:hypothetical protein
MIITGLVLYFGQARILVESPQFLGGIFMGLSLGMLGLLAFLGIFGVFRQNLAGVAGMFFGGIGIAQVLILPPMTSINFVGELIGLIPAIPAGLWIAKMIRESY